jgi:ABC-2 type transport system permease protein
MMIFGPIIGIALGFDAISKERASGSLSVLLSQPIFRDAVINGKFLAGFTALSLMVASTIGIMVGIAIPIVGFGPTGAETVGIIVFTLLTILYTGFWLALSMMFSTLLKKTTTSMLAVISMWIFFVFALSLLASLVATALVPYSSFVSSPPTIMEKEGTSYFQRSPSFDTFQQRANIQNGISSISPAYLYQQASNFIFTGFNIGGGIFISGSVMRPSTDLWQCWPQFTAIGVALVVCFVVAYIVFLRREIRPGG